jgi:hypothetical protein
MHQGAPCIPSSPTEHLRSRPGAAITNMCSSSRAPLGVMKLGTTTELQQATAAPEQPFRPPARSKDGSQHLVSVNLLLGGRQLVHGRPDSGSSWADCHAADPQLLHSTIRSTPSTRPVAWLATTPPVDARICSTLPSPRGPIRPWPVPVAAARALKPGLTFFPNAGCRDGGTPLVLGLDVAGWAWDAVNSCPGEGDRQGGARN